MLQTIFKAVSYDQADDLVFMYYDCTFLKDFGPWKKDYKVAGLNVDLDAGIIEEFDENGLKVINKCQIQLIPV